MADLLIRTAVISEVSQPVTQMMLDFWAARSSDY